MILVTGAAGTLGSEICRQLCFEGVAVTALDTNEYGLWQLANKLPIRSICDSITRGELWYKLKDWPISHVINCAAVKHVATAENWEGWAHEVNYLAIKHMVGQKWRLVHVSTDKAVVPINSYGLTKLNAERLVLHNSGTVVRLVNIHDSSGCAEEIFAEQIAKGGPVKARDRRMVRYFTTVDQAAWDVIIVMRNARPGLYMPDHGRGVLIDKLIGDMIGDRDIAVEYSGAGDEEKLIEDVLTPYEQFEPVEWSKRICKVVRK